MSPRPACADHDPEIFFGPADSPPGEPPYPWEWRALEVCWACPLVAPCLAEALRWSANTAWSGA